MPTEKSISSQKEFEELFMSNYRTLFHLGFRVCSEREFVKDVLQSFFLELWEKKIWESEVKYMPAYLRKAFYRKMLYEVKKDRKSFNRTIDTIPEPSTDAHETALIELEEAQESQRRMQAAWDVLPDKQRHVLDLRFKSGMDYDEIAASTGKSRQTIYNQIHEAIKKLRAKLASV